MTDNSTSASDDDSEIYNLLYTLTAFLSLESLLIIFFNGVVLFLFATIKYLRRKSNYCLVGLAIADFLAGIVVFPLWIICNHGDVHKVCIAFHLSQRVLVHSTILHLLLATIDRWLKIAFPFRYKSLLTSRRIVVMLVAVWIISFAVGVSEIPYTQESPESPDHKAYLLAVLVVMACVPFLVILILNLTTRRLILNRNKRSTILTAETQEKTSKQKKTICIYFSMATLSFVIGILAYFIIGYLTVRPAWLEVLIGILKFTTHFMNPMIYTFFKADFRQAFKRVILKQENPVLANRQNTMLTTVTTSNKI